MAFLWKLKKSILLVISLEMIFRIEWLIPAVPVEFRASRLPK
jgi:hypothetical protein